MSVPNPGSNEAIEQGCLCPVLDNAHGRGYMGQPDVFVMVAGCPLHDVPEDWTLDPWDTDSLPDIEAMR